MLLLISIIGSCEEKALKNKEEEEIKDNTIATFNPNGRIRLIQIDSCEYIVSTKGDAISTIHKQNCKFCTERNKK